MSLARGTARLVMLRGVDPKEPDADRLAIRFFERNGVAVRHLHDLPLNLLGSGVRGRVRKTGCGPGRGRILPWESGRSSGSALHGLHRFLRRVPEGVCDAVTGEAIHGDRADKGGDKDARRLFKLRGTHEGVEE